MPLQMISTRGQHGHNTSTIEMPYYCTVHCIVLHTILRCSMPYKTQYAGIKNYTVMCITEFLKITSEHVIFQCIFTFVGPNV